MRISTTCWLIPLALMSLSVACSAATPFEDACQNATAHDAAKEYDLARKGFETAQKLANTPDEKLSVLVGLSFVSSHMGNFRRASQELKRALALPGTSAGKKKSTGLLLAMALFNDHQRNAYQEGVNEAKREGDKIDPQTVPFLRTWIGETYIAEHNAAQALKEFTGILEIPRVPLTISSVVLVRMGRIYLAQGDATQARQAANKLLQLERDTVASHSRCKTPKPPE